MTDHSGQDGDTGQAGHTERGRGPARRGPRGLAARWSADLVLGVRLVAGGGRSSWTRLALTAVGVGLGVALLLLACAAPAILHAHRNRSALAGYTQSDAPSERTVLVGEMDTEYRGKPIHGLALQPVGPRPAVPPGLTALPRPGEMAVSPALRRLLSSSDGALLRQRLPYRMAGTVADRGLNGPNELLFYLGSARLSDRLADGAVTRVVHFGETDKDRALDPVLLLITVIAVVVLLVPVAVFIGAAVRFGAESRDRQQAALRLVGADRWMTRRIAAGEALVGALLGLVVGAVVFLAGRQLVGLVTLDDLSVFPSDVRPAPGLVALIVLLVPASAVAVGVLALRRVVVEPLGVVRRAGPVRRRLWWRLLVPAVGLGLLVPLLGGISRTGQRFNVYQVGAGATLLLVGVSALLPWLVEAVVRRLRGGGVPWQLAVRRLQLTSGSAARVVSGIAVAVTGAIGLLTLFAGIQHDYTRPTHQDPRRAQVYVEVPRTMTLARSDRLAASFAAVHGVRSVFAESRTTVAAITADADGTRPSYPLIVGDCATLRQIATIDRCADGDAFLSTEPGADYHQAPEAGARVAVTDITGTTVVGGWTVPGTARSVRPRTSPGGSTESGVLATPAAVDATLLGQLRTTLYVRTDPADADTLERVRNAASAADPLSVVLSLTLTHTSDTLVTIQRGVFLGATAVLLLIGASLLVTVLEQLRERRRLLAVLTAFGTRRRTLTASVLWQTAIPVVLGLALAVAGGVLLGGVLLRMTGEPVSFDWPSIGGITGVGAAVVLLVTILSMPALWRLMRPEGMRTE